MSRNGRKWLCAVLIGVNLAVIWGNSLLPGEVSSAFSQWVRGLAQWLFPGSFGGSGGHGLLRKLGHFTEFACLGMLLWWMGLLCRERPRFFPPLLLGAIAAGLDETIQRFVPGRGPSLWDVGIDVCGVLLGILLLTAGYYIKKAHFWRK